MDKNGALAAALLILAIAGASDASKLRALMAEGKGGDKPSTQKVSPSPTPDLSPKFDPLQSIPKPPPKTKQPTPQGASKSNGTSHKGQPESVSPASVPPPPSDTETKSQQDPKNGDHGKKDEDPRGSNSSTGSRSAVNTNQDAGCDAASEKCRAADLVACLQHPGDDSKELFLLVQNGGEEALTVNIKTSIHIDVNKLPVAKHSGEKISVPTNVTNITDIVLNAGKGDCILHIKPSISDWNPFQQFPAYATRLTPIHAAYFLFFSMVIAGGAWACCKFGRQSRRGDTGVPYQQLEMGTQLHSSSSVTDANTADGWDQSWDDDWDEEEAVARPSEKYPTVNVSSNGLTSRPPNKEGWDVDWDN